MSVRLVLTQESRPYKIEIYGLQDDYIGTLQSYNDSFIGQVIEPRMEISDDGSQTFTCSIPKFYINPENNLKVENPRWSDINNGVLAENTRVLKVFLNTGEETKVYPFIVDKIIDKRDSHFSVYRQIEASGLAFAELGKTGYKLELNSHTIETDYEADATTTPTINYWLDKVFPNKKLTNDAGELILDENGDPIISEWLTPWCYEIRMDWSHYSDKTRAANKLYEEDYINGWEIKEGNENVATQLVPTGIATQIEKARYIDCKNSNKYNITQSIAEMFEVFCVYEYKCDNHGQFIGTYYEKIDDDQSIAWTGRKVVFYNRAIKSDNPVVFTYKNNLATFSRTEDTSEIYTKLYVTPIESKDMTNGYVTIADAEANPLLEDYILNFDFLYETGAITDYQKRKVEEFKVQTRKYNLKIKDYESQISELTAELNNLKAETALIEKQISSIEEQLISYQKLRDNEVTNTPVIKDENNSYSIVLVPEGDLLVGNIKLYGVNAAGIKGYSSSKYDTSLFDQYTTVTSMDIEKKEDVWYVLLDEYGFASKIFTPKSSLGNDWVTGGLAYLKLQYSPKNYYEEICRFLESELEENNTNLKRYTELEQTQTDKLDNLISDEQDLLKQKTLYGYKFERIMGPALREGYWTPDSYEDIGTNVSGNTSANSAQVNFVWDEQPFISEQLNYYYDSIDMDDKKYYCYIDINNDFSIDKVIHLYQETYESAGGTGLAVGNYYVVYNNVPYYFKLTAATNHPLVLSIGVENSELKIVSLKAGDSSISFESSPLENATNITGSFENLNSALNDYKLYNNAGYVVSYREKEESTIQPIALLNNSALDFSRYTHYYIDGDSVGSQINYNPSSEYILVYPRIVINAGNVDYNSDLLTLTAGDSTVSLTKYKDYSILVRNGKPHFTLKTTKVNTVAHIIAEDYTINYRISRANDILFLDAQQVARDNAYPKYSYELSIANVPDKIEALELGQLAIISDFSLGVRAATGYISGLTYHLDAPQEDGIVIQNYKTKFEDLFSSITTNNEAMKVSKKSYDIAAGGFTSSGTIDGSILQTSINNNDISFNFSDTNISIDDIEGILLTNSKPYLNGVYGQVALRGGGIFMSSQVDAGGSRIWSTGITPTGINASMITAGQLDTNLIRVFAGENVAFQWNGEGIFAYKQNENGVDQNTYVRYSDKGLQFINNEHVDVDLGWNGLLISTQDGATELSGNDGLVVYDGVKNQDGTNHVVKIGRFLNDDAKEYDYGLRLYKKKSDGSYTTTLATSNSGELWLEDYLQIGENVGLSAIKSSNDNASTIDEEEEPVSATRSDVRIWAGTSHENRERAPFQVLEDGTLIATSAQISGSITTDTIDATKGTIGGWTITETNLYSDKAGLGRISLNSEHNSNNEAIVVHASDNTPVFSLEYNGVINAQAGSFANGKIVFNSKDGVIVQGNINADAGVIGGWNIDKSGLSKKVDKTSNSTAIKLIDENQATVFSIGNNGFLYAENANIKGTIFSDNANITGTITAKDGVIEKLYIGNKNSSHIILEGQTGSAKASASIRSSDYHPGVLGHGWSINNDGFAEFNNVSVRGTIKSVIFEQQEISAVAGKLYVGPTIIISAASDNITNSNSIVWSKGFTSSYSLEKEIIYYVTIEGIYTSDNSKYIGEGTIQINTNEDKDYLVFTPNKSNLKTNTTISTGAIMVIKGNSNNNSYGILINGGDSLGDGKTTSFIETYNISNDSQQVVTRLGSLDGLNNEYFGYLSGNGLYSTNAYLTGQLRLPGAGITNQTDKKYGEGDTLSSIRIWAGVNGTDPITEANFIVTENGYMYAKQGVFEGRVIAKDGEFTGHINALGILLDEEEATIIPKSNFYVAYESYDKNGNLILNPSTYVLNINRDGLSIWEGGLQAYSDYSGSDIYSYSTSNSTPLPYFYLVDSEGLSNFTNRIVGYRYHNFQLKKDNENYISNSILMDEGIWFYNTSSTINNKDWRAAENNIYSNFSKNNGIVLNDDKLEIIGAKINIKGNNVDSEVTLQGKLSFNNEMTITSVSGGINII